MILQLPGRSFQLRSGSSAGFTLVELMMVLIIIGIAFAFAFQNSSSAITLRQQALIRKLSETIRFLHHQAVSDQAFYRLEIDFERNQYRVGVLRPEPGADDRFLELAQDAGSLTLELSAFLNPSPGRTYTFIPPPYHPSLYEPVRLLEDMSFNQVRNMSGLHSRGTSQTAGISFSPRGFSEFAVIQMTLLNGAPVTILVNPFSGLTTVYNEHKDFEWTFTRYDRPS